MPSPLFSLFSCQLLSLGEGILAESAGRALPIIGKIFPLYAFGFFIINISAGAFVFHRDLLFVVFT